MCLPDPLEGVAEVIEHGKPVRGGPEIAIDPLNQIRRADRPEIVQPVADRGGGHTEFLRRTGDRAMPHHRLERAQRRHGGCSRHPRPFYLR